MSAVLTAQEPSAKYLVNLQPPQVRYFDLIAQAPGGVARLRALILTLAVQGKLVPQDPNDEPASELLKKIRTKKDRLIAEGKIKRSKLQIEINADEKPFVTPADWEWIRLGESMEMLNGKAFKPSDWLPSGLPIVRIQNLNKLEAGFNYCDPETISEKNKINDGSLLISWSGTPGTSFGAFIWQRGAAALNQHIFKCELIGNAFVPEFLKLAINSQLNVLIAKAQGGVGLQHVTKGTLESLVLVLPPLAEQSRIVTRVEELMQVCDALEASGQLEAQQHAQLVNTLLSTLTQSETPEALADNWQRIATHFDVLLDRPEAVDALEQTILQLAVRGLLVPQDPTDEPASVLLQKIRTEKDHLIAQGKIKRDKPLPPITDEEKPFELPQGWAWVTIDTLASVGTGTTPSRDNASFFEGGAIPWVTSGETGQPFIRQTDQHVTEAALAQTSLTIYPIGTLVVAMYGQGKTRGQISELCIPATTNQACAAIVLVEPSTAHKDYVKLVFEKSYDEIRELSAGGAQPNLNVGKVKATLIPLPPLGEQNRIVTSVNALRDLLTELRRRLTACHVNQAQLAHVLAASN